MWVEWLHNSDMVGLNLAEVGAYWQLYAFAHSCDDDGRLVSESGQPLNLERIQLNLHVKQGHDSRAFASMVNKLVSSGYLNWDGETLVVTHYKEEQEPTTDSSIKGTKEALRRRQQKWRDKQRQARDAKKVPPPSKKEEESIRTIDLLEGTPLRNGVISVTQTPLPGINVTDNPSPTPKKDTQDIDETAKKVDLAEPQPVTDYPLHIFDYWNSHAIIIHKAQSFKVTSLQTALKTTLKTYSCEEVCQAITNYADILHHPEEYYWSYKWTLEEFLHRGIEKFMNAEVARSNYRIDKGGPHDTGTSPGRTGRPDGSHQRSVTKAQPPASEYDQRDAAWRERQGAG